MKAERRSGQHQSLHDLAEKIIADFKEQYSLPYEPASASHLEDCIVSEVEELLATLQAKYPVACYKCGSIDPSCPECRSQKNFEAFVREESAKAVKSDTDRLNWLIQRGATPVRRDSWVVYLGSDHGDMYVAGEGKTPREAIDDAMRKEAGK